MKQNATAEVLDLKPPSDPDAEMMLLRAIMLKPELIEAEDISTDLFHEWSHSEIFKTIAILREECQPIDTKHVWTRMGEEAQLDAVGGFEKFKEIVAGEALPAKTVDYLAALRDKHTRRKMLRLAENLAQNVHGNMPTDELLAWGRERIDAASGVIQSATDADRFTIRRITSRELDEGEYTTKYLVEGVMAERQPLVIAAPLKTLKTTIAVALAVSLALGRSFLGKFWVAEAVNVLMLSGESGMGSLQSAGRRIAESYGHRLSELERLIWSTDLPKLDNPSHIEAFREALTREAIRVVILDPLYFVLPGADAGNLMVVGGYLRTLNQVCEECGVTLVVVHHVKRSTGRDAGTPADLADISWAGTAEWARQWILLSRRKPYEPNSGQHDLWMVTGGSAGHSGQHALDVYEGVGDDRTWQVDVLDQDAVRATDEDRRDRSRQQAEQAKLEGLKRKFVAALVKFPEGETLSGIRDRAGMNGPNAAQALAALLDDGHVVQCEVVKANRKTAYDGYKLASEPPEGSYGTNGTRASGQASPTGDPHLSDQPLCNRGCPSGGGSGPAREVRNISPSPSGQFVPGVVGRFEVGDVARGEA